MKAGVFNDSKMNDAVWKFRNFEEPSLSYGDDGHLTAIHGGWSLRRDERFAALVRGEVLQPGDVLTGPEDVTAVVTEDYGLSFQGIRFDSPDAAAEAATGDKAADGWSFWRGTTSFGDGTLAELLQLTDAST